MSETLKLTPEQEPRTLYEIEQKFIPLQAEALTSLRAEAIPIEQFYLSHPDEDFSLRFREVPIEGQFYYEATLKNNGELTDAGLRRLEVTTEVDKAMYDYYRKDSVAIRKLRAMLTPNVVVDFFEDGHTQVESECAADWQSFIKTRRLEGQFAELTGDRIVDNEWRAHHLYRQHHGGREALPVMQELDPNQIANDIIRHQHEYGRSVVQISGRSGSGKSTVVQMVKQQLEQEGIDCDVISTDDYHRGQTWLEAYNDNRPWVNWDDAIVYDTASMAADLERLQRGESIRRRRIDFETAEPVYEGDQQPKPVLLVEGIYARAPEIDQYCHLRYELPTPLATCVGRRLLRDMHERAQFADPAVSLRYMLEYAEPAYRQQRDNVIT